ncbi:MAG TPA: hypothetical protein VFI25_17230 [Planctomycetota bacterium]|jgi:hypothetical protein|nr:hypothetical protein [Planctomycetota bacterium]
MNPTRIARIVGLATSVLLSASACASAEPSAGSAPVYRIGVAGGG